MYVGDKIRRLPDGETGSRTNWIAWQRDVFASTSQLEPCSDAPNSTFRIKGSASPQDIELSELGYSRAAKASYLVFQRLKDENVIPKHIKFQVSLPTPLAPIQFFISQECRDILEPIYEAALLKELQELLTEIPHDELAIQWDTAVEFGVLEGAFPAYFANPYESIVDRLVCLGNAIPITVDLGYHLCYGDSGHKHFIEPLDTSWLTRVSNGVIAGLSRGIDWIHLPVPRNRVDEAYYQSLQGLNLSSGTELYLGLLHASDGEEGALKRVAAAKTAVSGFGIATECGFGRRSKESIPSLLKLHAKVSRLTDVDR